ncbi:eukaryotic type KH-domain (KH-domain type I) [Lindgomyces ingoldianus]|uniref:Eukaryotic type KH-domain (KH-domain type I) n=1 Tax=Lindgomyces ingoldianus TaxID=673940 RepID=A0ACB6R674_9PLEO|nr:eukaryotic type KH-domain (KH-domain type I) [Lindgomyces ingoldianus]KAF2474555.1 eukaryotic type KH-domain (KH-domain type I) [Lindgomyces ingoldianus]
MPAPTAPLRSPEALAEDQTMAEATPLPADEDTELLDMNALPDAIPAAPSGSTSSRKRGKALGKGKGKGKGKARDTQPEDVVMTDEGGRPRFAPAKAIPLAFRREQRKVPIPPHRITPLKNSWPKIYPPLVEHLKLQCRMNQKTKSVELRSSSHTTDTGALQKGEDFVKAFTLGFDVDDAIALLRLDDLYIETFEIKDVKTLSGEHLSRAIGRIAGKDGKTKFAIENSSRTRVVLADQKIHILGGFKNIHIAREAIVSLILGAPPGKVYGNLRTVASRMKERF